MSRWNTLRSSARRSVRSSIEGEAEAQKQIREALLLSPNKKLRDRMNSFSSIKDGRASKLRPKSFEGGGERIGAADRLGCLPDIAGSFLRQLDAPSCHMPLDMCEDVLCAAAGCNRKCDGEEHRTVSEAALGGLWAAHPLALGGGLSRPGEKADALSARGGAVIIRKNVGEEHRRFFSFQSCLDGD